jgi:DNA-binding LytR/AlgR family response regulator
MASRRLDDGIARYLGIGTLLEGGSLAEIDGLISDIDLSKIDGIGLLRPLCAARPALPVLLITGHPKWSIDHHPSA